MPSSPTQRGPLFPLRCLAGKAQVELLVVVTGLLFATTTTLHAQGGVKTLSGTVTDGHEPLKGAVVQVENEATEAVATYLTDASGHYIFKHLNGGSDYKFWATYRGHRSRSKSLSKFNSRMAPVVELRIKLE